MKRILIAATLASFAFAAQAADVNKGAELVAKGNCAACHGEGLNKPLAPEYPKLAGQHADYVFYALKAYKTTNNPNVGRNNAIMAGQVAALSNNDLKDIAAYVASLPGSLVMKK
jgi:cytochrome c553